MSDEDREAVRRVQAGETEAFEVLVEKYKRKTFPLAYSVLRDQEESLDVAQEAFVKAFRSLPKFKGDSAFYTWLFRITMNLALDHKRQRATRAKALGAEDVSPEEWERTAVSTDRDPEDEAAGTQRRARITRALESLSENHRTIIILSDIEGLPYRDIAEVLGIPMGTVMSRLHNARKRLRQALGPGFLVVVLVVALASGLPASTLAQGQAPSPFGVPPPVGAPGPDQPGQAPSTPFGAPPPAGAPVPDKPTQQVCVYALVILASNEPAGTPGGGPSLPQGRGRGRGGSGQRGLAPVPEREDESAPPTPGGACGRPMRLKPWVPRLREVFGYSHYEPMSAFETTMPLGMTQRFALPGGRELAILPLAIRPPVVRIEVKILRGPMTEIATVMDVPSRRPALIGGPPHAHGVLIIAIRSSIEP